MISLPQNAALIVIDVQKGMDDPYWGARNHPDAENRIAALLARLAPNRTARLPRPASVYLGSFSAQPSKARLRNQGDCPPLENEPVFQKRVNSAFIGTQLEATLRQAGMGTLVLVGLTTPHCVSTSARMAGNLGFEVLLPEDAIAAFAITGPDGKRYTAEEVHSLSLATLHGEFATVVDSMALLEAASRP